MVGLMFLKIFYYRAFREQQKSRKIEIVSQILQEKASIRKQKNRPSCTKAIKNGGKLRDSLLWRRKTWHYIEKTCGHPAGAISQVSKGLRITIFSGFFLFVCLCCFFVCFCVFFFLSER